MKNLAKEIKNLIERYNTLDAETEVLISHTTADTEDEMWEKVDRKLEEQYGIADRLIALLGSVGIDEQTAKAMVYNRQDRLTMYRLAAAE